MRRIDVYGIGNALVDHEYLVSNSTLRDLRIDKGHMTLIDHERMLALRSALSEYDAHLRPGGSAANSVYAVSGFGGAAFYSCSTVDDENGRYFLESMKAAGIAITPSEDRLQLSTGCCLVLVTPDAERSMNTYLGASADVAFESISIPALESARALYIEGYLAASACSVETAVQAREIAEKSAVQVCLTLSDPNVILAFRPQLIRMLGNGVDTVFCNEEEALIWCGTDRLDIAVRELRDIAPTVVVTLGPKGCLLVEGSRSLPVETTAVPAKDVNGAGDMFAGAFLACTTRGLDGSAAAAFANHAAAHTVQTLGARLGGLPVYRELWSSFGLPT